MRKSDLIGRTIVAIETNHFLRGMHSESRMGFAHQYTLILDNGARVSFEAEETEVGEYGVEIFVHKKAKSQHEL